MSRPNEPPGPAILTDMDTGEEFPCKHGWWWEDWDIGTDYDVCMFCKLEREGTRSREKRLAAEDRYIFSLMMP